MKKKEFHWNYRLIKKTFQHKEFRYDLHEVYYLNGKENMTSSEPIVTGYDTQKETIAMLAMMLKDAKNPVFVPPKKWKVKDVK